MLAPPWRTQVASAQFEASIELERSEADLLARFDATEGGRNWNKLTELRVAVEFAEAACVKAQRALHVLTRAGGDTAEAASTEGDAMAAAAAAADDVVAAAENEVEDEEEEEDDGLERMVAARARSRGGHGRHGGGGGGARAKGSKAKGGGKKK